MKKRVLLLSLLVGLISFSGTALIGETVNAELDTKCPDTSFFGQDYCGDDGDIAGDALPRLIIDVLNWALVGVGTIVVIFIVIGGIIYMTAAGSAEQAKKGTTMIRNALLGLVLYLVMISVLNFLIPGGIFSGT